MRKKLLILMAIVGAAPNGRLFAVTTAGDPGSYIVRPGSRLDGVARLNITTTGGAVRCSGALTGSGSFVLTAAHCVTDGSGVLDVISTSVFFQSDAGPVDLSGLEYHVYPRWTGDLGFGDDLALIRLATPAPASVPRFDIYRERDEIGRLGRIAGWGVGGTGATGAQRNRYPSGTLRSGLNRLDTGGEVFMFTNGSNALTYDFDDGTPLRDGYGYLGIIADRGTGLEEVMIAAGDSGGPTLLDGRIAGIHSFRGTAGSPPDINFIEGDASFGEFGGDTRVSSYARFIDEVMAVPDVPTYLTSGTVLLLLFALRLKGWWAQ